MFDIAYIIMCKIETSNEIFPEEVFLNYKKARIKICKLEKEQNNNLINEFKRTKNHYLMSSNSDFPKKKYYIKKVRFNNTPEEEVEMTTKEIQHENTDEIVCPYCGEDDHEESVFVSDDCYYQMTCEKCSKIFFATTELVYNTLKKEDFEKEYPEDE